MTSGILQILNDINPKKSGALNPCSEAELATAKANLENASLTVLFEELDYDERCLDVYFQKLSSYEVRTRQRHDDWQKKRLDRAKAAVTQYWNSKVAGLYFNIFF